MCFQEQSSTQALLWFKKIAFIKIDQEKGGRRDWLVSPEDSLVTHEWWKIRHVNKTKTYPWIGVVEEKDWSFIDDTSIFKLQSLYSSLSPVIELNYKLENRDTTSLYYLTKNLNPKNKEKNLN